MATNLPEAQEKCPACGEANCFDYELRTRFDLAIEKAEAQPCCGPDIRRDYEISADNKTMRCTDCGKTYTRERIQTEAQPRGGELKPCRWCLGPADLTSENNGDEGDGYMWHVFCAEENDCTMMPDLYATSKSEAVRRWNSRADLPRATGETTVEAALAELREMFPDATFLSVKKHAIYQPSMGDLPNQADVQIEDKGFRRETLADCMAQVRAATRTEGEGEKS